MNVLVSSVNGYAWNQIQPASVRSNPNVNVSKTCGVPSQMYLFRPMSMRVPKVLGVPIPEPAARAVAGDDQVGVRQRGLLGQLRLVPDVHTEVGGAPARISSRPRRPMLKP
jgi:hypothetical protein